jgi:hypothetical protein
MTGQIRRGTAGSSGAFVLQQLIAVDNDWEKVKY